MDSTEAACSKDLDASEMGQQHSAGDGGASVEGPVRQSHATYIAEVASRELHCVCLASRRGESDQLLWFHAYTCYAVEDANGGWDAAIRSDYAFEEGCKGYVFRIGEACMGQLSVFIYIYIYIYMCMCEYLPCV